MQNIVDRGCEIGLHGGYHNYNNISAILKEKEKLEKILGKKIIGYRNHFLRFKVPDTWTILSKAGFKYDTTLAYAEMIGFRNGMCHPFKPFNLNINKEIDILEIPLIIMDGTLSKYMHLNLNKSWELCKNLIDEVDKYNGVLTLVWHNDSFDEIYFKDRCRLYKKILNECYKREAWMTSGKEIWSWWNKNNFFNN
jgi:peptidoglycan/xylan/chitin deacetylase (PgdA/CDA1 family)